MQVANYLGLLRSSEEQLAAAFERVGKQHAVDTDVLQMCQLFASWSKDNALNIKKLTERYGEKKDDEAKDLSSALFETRTGGMGLLRDLQALWLMASEAEICYIILNQAAQALRDRDLELSCKEFYTHTHRQKAWLLTKMKHSAAQVLVVADS